MQKYKLINGIGKNENINSVIDDLLSIEQSSWDDKMQVGRENLIKRLEIFPDGLCRLVDSKNNKTLSYLYFILLDESTILSMKTWDNITGEGTASTHNNNGDAIFGVTLGSKKVGYGRLILQEAIKDFRKNKKFNSVKNIYLCGRIPSLSKYYNKFTKPEDIDFDKVLEDTTICIFRSAGFNVSELVYGGYEVDKYSLGYSALLRQSLL